MCLSHTPFFLTKLIKSTLMDYNFHFGWMQDIYYKISTLGCTQADLKQSLFPLCKTGCMLMWDGNNKDKIQSKEQLKNILEGDGKITNTYTFRRFASLRSMSWSEISKSGLELVDYFWYQNWSYQPYRPFHLGDNSLGKKISKVVKNI